VLILIDHQVYQAWIGREATTYSLVMSHSGGVYQAWIGREATTTAVVFRHKGIITLKTFRIEPYEAF
tara:strand:- start:1512 stop:1712 length:201 start_codon:yes stop_codon:yes gene_type:complete